MAKYKDNYRRRIAAYLNSSRRNGAAFLGMKDAVNALLEEELQNVPKFTKSERQVIEVLDQALSLFEQALADSGLPEDVKETQRQVFELAISMAQNAVFSFIGIKSVNFS